MANIQRQSATKQKNLLILNVPANQLINPGETQQIKVRDFDFIDPQYLAWLRMTGDEEDICRTNCKNEMSADKCQHKCQTATAANIDNLEEFKRLLKDVRGQTPLTITRSGNKLLIKKEANQASQRH